MISSAKPLDGKTVLIVDDQKFLRNILAQGLKGAGAKVVEASDGFEALSILGLGDRMSDRMEAMKRQRPDMFAGTADRRAIDCVVSDIRMTPMNGLEMLKAVRSGFSSARRDLPFVVMSAHADEPLIGAAIALDAHGFVAKPVSQAEIVDRILRAQRVQLPIKPAEAYALLIVPELNAAMMETDVGKLAESVVAVIRAGDVAALAGQNKVTVGLHDLKADDVLADDVKTVSGRLVIPSGTKVTLALIAALGDLAKIAKLVDKIAVRR